MPLPPFAICCDRRLEARGSTSSRFGPTVPVVPASSSVWQPPHARREDRLRVVCLRARPAALARVPGHAATYAAIADELLFREVVRLVVRVVELRHRRRRDLHLLERRPRRTCSRRSPGRAACPKASSRFGPICPRARVREDVAGAALLRRRAPCRAGVSAASRLDDLRRRSPRARGRARTSPRPRAAR